MVRGDQGDQQEILEGMELLVRLDQRDQEDLMEILDVMVEPESLVPAVLQEIEVQLDLQERLVFLMMYILKSCT